MAKGGRLEAIPPERVAEVFRRRFEGWIEENREATAALLEIVGGGRAR